MGWRDDVEAGQCGPGAEREMNRCDDVREVSHHRSFEIRYEPMSLVFHLSSPSMSNLWRARLCISLW